MELKNDGRAKLVCAVYDENGVMRGAATTSVKANCGEATVSLSGIGVSDGKIHVLLVDSSWTPLCKCREIK